MKFLPTLFLALLISLLSVSGHYATCSKANWMQHDRLLGLINHVVTAKSGVLASIRKKYIPESFPINLQESNLTNNEFTIVGTSYRIKAANGTVNIPGLKDLDIQPIKATTPTFVKLIAQSNEHLNASIQVEISYSKKEWVVPFMNIKICPWELKFWNPCPETRAFIDGTVETKDLRAETIATFEFYDCNQNFITKRGGIAAHAIGEVMKQLTQNSLNTLSRMVTGKNMCSTSSFMGNFFKSIGKLEATSLDIQYDELKVSEKMIDFEKGTTARYSSRMLKGAVRATRVIPKQWILDTLNKRVFIILNDMLKQLQALHPNSCGRERN